MINFLSFSIGHASDHSAKSSNYMYVNLWILIRNYWQRSNESIGIYTFYLHNMQLIRFGSYFVYLTYEKWRPCTYMYLCLNFNNMWVYFIEFPLFTFTSRLFNGDNKWLTYIISVLLTEMLLVNLHSITQKTFLKRELIKFSMVAYCKYF